MRTKSSKPPSPATVAARQRAWKILRLRGMISSANELMSPDDAASVRRIVIGSLLKLGVKDNASN